MKTNIHFWSYIPQYFLEWEMFQKKNCRWNQNKYFIFNNFFFNRAVYEIKKKNTVELDKSHMTI
jgi:hypothetical protein